MPVLGLGGATGSWWPAGSLAPVQPNAGRMGRVCATHVSLYTYVAAPVLVVLTGAVVRGPDAAEFNSCIQTHKLINNLI